MNFVFAAAEMLHLLRYTTVHMRACMCVWLSVLRLQLFGSSVDCSRRIYRRHASVVPVMAKVGAVGV
mgnify:CR=1 FL=1